MRRSVVDRGQLLINGDWRLPTKEEWEAFVDTGYTVPALCNAAGDAKWSQGDTLNDVMTYYWSSTELNSNYAWFANLGNGNVSNSEKTNNNYVWPVRSDN